MLTLLENADIYAPEPLGIGCLLVGGDIGNIDCVIRVGEMVQHGTPLRAGLFEGRFEGPESSD